jgi:hypothetical protein
LLVASLAGQPAASPLTLLSREGRRALPVAVVGGREFVALDDLASAFQLTVVQDTGAVTVSNRGRNIVLTPNQTLASVAGKLVSLPAPLTRSGDRWLVPFEFISNAPRPHLRHAPRPAPAVAAGRHRRLAGAADHGGGREFAQRDAVYLRCHAPRRRTRSPRRPAVSSSGSRQTHST